MNEINTTLQAKRCSVNIFSALLAPFIIPKLFCYVTGENLTNHYCESKLKVFNFVIAIAS